MIRNGRRYYLSREESELLYQNDVRPDEEALRLRNDFFHTIRETIVDTRIDEDGALWARAVDLDEDLILSSLAKLTLEEKARKSKPFSVTSVYIQISNSTRASYKYNTVAMPSDVVSDLSSETGFRAGNNISVVAA